MTRRFTLQWHITERCNRRCAHCYQDQLASELPLAGLLEGLGQFRELISDLRRHSSAGWLGHVNVTGGEPFLRKDFFDLLEAFRANRRWMSFAILCNGSLIDPAVAKRLRRLRPSFVQVSMEGLAPVHDAIRGPGDFAQTVQTLKLLIRHGIRTMISFTAHRENYREFPAVARLGCELGVSKVWTDRLIPFGVGAQLECLSPAETSAYFDSIRTARAELSRGRTRSTVIAMDRALQFLAGGGMAYRCTAGESLLALLPNGDLLPCRRLPIPVGNIRERALAEWYTRSPILRQLQDRDRVMEGCEDCWHASRCRGGLRCLAFATSGDPFRADPGCGLATDQTPAPGNTMNPCATLVQLGS